MEAALLPVSPPLLLHPSSPFATAPSSPGVSSVNDFPRAIYFSAPTSPARNSTTRDDDFEFEFSGQLDFSRQSASAEELFDNGPWIRPPKPPPRAQSGGTGTVSSGFDPVEAAAKEEEEEEEGQETPLMHCYKRGRNRKAVQGGSVARRETRSLSPLRLSDIIFGDTIEDEGTEGRGRDIEQETRATPYLSRLMCVFGNARGYGYRRWRLRDLLLFRSVSEGTGTRSLRTKEGDTARSSFRSNEGSVGSTRSNRARQAAASRTNSVELHYTTNRAVSEEMKRKTFLPYRQGVLGCLGLGGDSARWIGSSTRGQ